MTSRLHRELRVTTNRPRDRHTTSRRHLPGPMESLIHRDRLATRHLQGHTTNPPHRRGPLESRHPRDPTGSLHLRGPMESLLRQGRLEKHPLQGHTINLLRRRGPMASLHLHDHRESLRLRGHMTSRTPHRGRMISPRTQEGPTIGPTTVHLTVRLSMRCLGAAASRAQGLRLPGRIRMCLPTPSPGRQTRAHGPRRRMPSTPDPPKAMTSPTVQLRTQDPKVLCPTALPTSLSSRCPDPPECRCRKWESRTSSLLSPTSNPVLLRQWS